MGQGQLPELRQKAGLHIGVVADNLVEE